jgi:RNA polymerase primary sigma factor
MVVDSLTTENGAPGLNIRLLRTIPVQRVRTQAAANAARRIAERLASGSGSVGSLDEQEVFTAMHVCAYRATNQGVGVDGLLDARSQWAHRWKLIRDYIVEENIGLTYTMGTRFRNRDVDWDDIRSEAFYALVRAVEGFNPWYGFRFSTYACNAIRRALIHLGRKVNQYRIRFPVEHETWIEQSDQGDEWSELYVDRLNQALHQNLAELTDRESMVLGWRFPRDGGAAMTLGEVGDAIGLSKERVRQIQKTALAKLRDVLEGDPALQ